MYADSQTPVSAEGYQYGESAAGLAAFAEGFSTLEAIPCDILITPHPAASRFWDRLASGAEGVIDPEACRAYAEAGRRQLTRRLEEEASRR